MLTNEQVKTIRMYLGMTQAQFAERTELTRETIAKIETDRVPVTPRSYDRIIKTIELDEDFYQYVEKRKEVRRILDGLRTES